MNPLAEKIFIGIAGVLGIWGLIYMLSTFLTQGLFYIAAAVAGTAAVGSLVWIFTLWRIARDTYGHGIQYTVIYGANKDQIRDPDLIYPGQIFSLPRPEAVN